MIKKIKFFSERLNSSDLNIDQKITIARGFFEYFRNIKNFDELYKYLEIMNGLCFQIGDLILIKKKSYLKTCRK